MLTVLLVWTIALGSLSIFLAGMIFPELSRKNDLIWVGVGLFYALLLWANKNTMGGGLLLGQVAGVSLTVWLGWQAMTQRRELTPLDKKTPVPDWLQKIIDVVTPLWEKAYGAIAGQLGLDQASAAPGTAEAENALSGLKSKAMGLLDKLNNKPDSADLSPAADTEGLDEDWDENEADEEAIASEPEAISEPEVTAEATAEVVAKEDGVAEAAPPTGPSEEVIDSSTNVAADSIPEASDDTASTTIETPPVSEDHSAAAPDPAPSEEPASTDPGVQSASPTQTDPQSDPTVHTQDSPSSVSDVESIPTSSESESTSSSEPESMPEEPTKSSAPESIPQEEVQEESNWPPPESMS